MAKTPVPDQPQPKESVEEGTVEMVPMHSIILSRPTSQKDKDGNPVHRQHVTEIGKVFKFTQEEVDHIKETSPAALRDPQNEGGPQDFLAEIDQAGAAAADAARRHGSAAGDARRVAQSGAGGKAALGDVQKSQGAVGELPPEDEL